MPHGQALWGIMGLGQVDVPSRYTSFLFPISRIYSDNSYLLVGAQALYVGLFLCSRFGLMSKMFSEEVSHFMHDTGHVMWFWRVLRLAEPNLESRHPLLPTMVWSFFVGIDSIELMFVGALQYITSPWFQYCHAQLQVILHKFHIKDGQFSQLSCVPSTLQVFVANHTSMIDFIILEQMTAFAVIMQKHPGWVGQSYILYSVRHASSWHMCFWTVYLLILLYIFLWFL